MITERQLNDRELKTLDKRVRDIGRRKSRLTRFMVFWTLSCLIIGTVVSFYVDRELWILLAITTVAFIAAGLWGILESKSPFEKELKGIENLKEINRVTSIQVKTTKYYELSEEEDEGIYYLFQILPDKILSFGGQDFYPTKKFPNSDFEIVEGKSSSGQIILLETYCHGDKIKPKRKIKGKAKWDVLQKLNPDKFEIRNGRLESFV